MKVVVDYERCESNALCMAACPEVFDVRDDDLLYLLDAEPDQRLREQVEAAVRACPRTAISLID